MSVNSVTISGNVGRDPELRSTAGGTGVLGFSVAVNERVKRGDSWEDYTNWVDVVIFGKRAESLSRILTKGMKVAVSGRLHYSSWEKDGQKRSKMEVVANEVDLMQRRDQSVQKGSQGNQAPADQYDDYYAQDMPF